MVQDKVEQQLIEEQQEADFALEEDDADFALEEDDVDFALEEDDVDAETIGENETDTGSEDILHAGIPIDYLDGNSEIKTTNNIQLPLRVEVAQVKMSVDKLLQLKIGDALELGNYNKSVNLYLGDLLVARGKLVELHGMLAIKILEKN